MRYTTGDLLGYRFGGTEEAHLVAIYEAADMVEAQRQRDWVKVHQNATLWALQCGKCVLYTHSDGSMELTPVQKI